MDDAGLVQRVRRLGHLADQLDDVPDVVAARRLGRRGRNGGRSAPGRALGVVGVLSGRSAARASWQAVLSDGVPGRQVDVRGARAPALQLAADGRQGRPLDQLHRVEPLVGLGARGEDLDQVRVLDPAQRVDLAGEAGLGLGVAGACSRHLSATCRPSDGCQAR